MWAGLAATPVRPLAVYDWTCMYGATDAGRAKGHQTEVP